MELTRSFWDVVQSIRPLEKPGHGGLRRVAELYECLERNPDEVFVAETYALQPFCFDLERYGDLYEFTLNIEVDPDFDWVGYVLLSTGREKLDDLEPWYVELNHRCFLPISSSEGLPAKGIIEYIDWILGSPQFHERFESFGMPWFADRVLFELYR